MRKFTTLLAGVFAAASVHAAEPGAFDPAVCKSDQVDTSFTQVLGTLEYFSASTNDGVAHIETILFGTDGKAAVLDAKSADSLDPSVDATVRTAFFAETVRNGKINYAMLDQGQNKMCDITAETYYKALLTGIQP